MDQTSSFAENTNVGRKGTQALEPQLNRRRLGIANGSNESSDESDDLAGS